MALLYLDGVARPFAFDRLLIPVLVAGFGLALVFSFSPAHAAEVDTWSSFRGSANDLEAEPVLPDGPYGLAVEWQIEIGSGYSNISLADGRVVTAFTSGEVDVLAAFEAASGDEIWRYEIGPKYAGHDGSDDGPMSTPAIDRGVVYLVGGHGQVVAVDAATGSRKWQFDLTEDNSTTPEWGYATSPVVLGDLVYIATGGEGHALTALDRITGEPAWTSGTDDVAYQTPSVLEIDGRAVIVLAGRQHLLAFDAGDGRVLWSLRHTEGTQTEDLPHVVDLGAGRFVVNYDAGAKLYQATLDEVEEVWSTRALGRGYAIPVRVGGHLYGFTGSILTSVDVATGEIAWRVRALESLGLARVGDDLAVLESSGALVIVDANPDGYREVTRIKALEAGDHPFPAFGDGAFYVRNLSHLAKVRVDRNLQPTLAPVETTARLGDFGAWLEGVEAMPEGRRQAAVEERFASIEESPLIEGEDGLVHFFHRGKAQDVAISFNGQPAEAFEHLAGTDLWWHSVELQPASQYAYQLAVDYESPGPDPSNPQSSDEGFAVFSQVYTPGWPAESHLDDPAEDAQRGTIDVFQFRSEILDNTRQIEVWRPHDYDADATVRYPTLYVNHGGQYLDFASFSNTLDNLVGKSVRPLVAVFVPRSDAAEYGGAKADDYNRFLTAELIPHVDRHYRTDRKNRAIMGPGSAAVSAIYAALRLPEVFQRAALQTFYPTDPMVEEITRLIAAGGPKPEHVLVTYSNRDYDFGNTLTAEEASKRLLEELRQQQVPVTELPMGYTPLFAGWKGQQDDILETLFPAEDSAYGE